MKTRAQPAGPAYAQDSGCFVAPSGQASFWCPTSEARDILWDGITVVETTNVPADTVAQQTGVLTPGLYLVEVSLSCEINGGLVNQLVTLRAGGSDLDTISTGLSGSTSRLTALVRVPSGTIALVSRPAIAAGEIMWTTLKYKFLSR